MASTKQQDFQKARLLLWVWYAGQLKQPTTEAQAVRKLKRKAENATDYRSLIEQLKQQGAIATEKKTCLLTTEGEVLLGQCILQSDFQLSGTIVGTWVANALLAWLRSRNDQQSSSASAATQNGLNGNGLNGNGSNGKSSGASIGNYEDFQAMALETYERLNQDYNLDNLVPIYRIRRELGDRLSRSNFDEWLLELQTQDVVQLIGGEMPELTPDKSEDSIHTRMGAIRYYVKRL